MLVAITTFYSVLSAVNVAQPLRSLPLHFRVSHYTIVLPTPKFWKETCAVHYPYVPYICENKSTTGFNIRTWWSVSLQLQSWVLQSARDLKSQQTRSCKALRSLSSDVVCFISDSFSDSARSLSRRSFSKSSLYTAICEATATPRKRCIGSRNTTGW